MTLDILSALKDSPQDVFKIFKSDKGDSGYFKKLTKKLVDPLAKSYSVLDEIFVEGLDSNQVFGQTKMVLDGVNESLLYDKIPSMREELGDSDMHQEVIDRNGPSSSESEAESVEDDLVPQSDSSTLYDVDQDFAEQNENEEGFESDSENVSGKEEAENDSRTEVPLGEEEDEMHIKDVFGLNDGFFDIDEFNKQTLALEDDQEVSNEQQEVDYFAELSDDASEDEMDYFNDFYEKPLHRSTKNKKRIESEDILQNEDEDEFDEEDYDKAVGSAMKDLLADNVEQEKRSSENLSTFEKKQREIQSEINKLEAELIADKKWTMKGEISSKDRPQDSLLEDPEAPTLEFDRTAKPVPVITEEVTETLEEIIRRRIKNEEFDDLPKRIITDVSKFYNKQKYDLSEEKSSKSLAEIYEDEYKQVDPNEKVNEELKKQHDEIRELFDKVNYKLDALSSAHFVPKPHQARSIEIKVTDDTPVISMEDAQPLHVPSGSSLAPQEIYKIGDERPSSGVEGKKEVQLKSGLSYSKEELSRNEKQRLRRANKRKKSKEYNHRKEIKEQVNNQSSSKEPPNKRQKTNEVINTLSRAKNLTIIGKKGEFTDAKGNLKKQRGPQTSNNYML